MIWKDLYDFFPSIEKRPAAMQGAFVYTYCIVAYTNSNWIFFHFNPSLKSFTPPVKQKPAKRRVRYYEVIYCCKRPNHTNL